MNDKDWVQRIEWHDPKPLDRLERYRIALEQIANFGHVEGCTSSAPVYECGCYPKSQAEIAREALDN